MWWNVTKQQRLSAYAYNGILPGPVIRVRNGELVRLRLVDAGQLGHPLHLHGTSFRIIARDGHATT